MPMRALLPLLLHAGLATALPAIPANDRGPTLPERTTDQNTMTTLLTDPTVRAAIEALNAHDRKAWDTLLAPGATFSDDGHEGDLPHFSDNAFGKGREHFTAIDTVEHGGLHVYGRYHSDTWGDFRTYFKFTVKDGRITRLEVGQAG